MTEFRMEDHLHDTWQEIKSVRDEVQKLIERIRPANALAANDLREIERRLWVLEQSAEEIYKEF